MPEFPRIDWLEPRCEDQGSHLDFMALCLLREIDRLCRAKFLAGSTFSLFKIEAMFRVNGVLQRNSLGVSHVGRLAPAQTLVEFILHLARAFRRTKAAGHASAQVHIAWSLIQSDLEMACRAPDGFDLRQGVENDV